MRDAKAILTEQYLEMRWRALSLAADFDRLQRAPGGDDLLEADPRVAGLRQACELIVSPDPDRAERLQLLLSDRSPIQP